MLGVEVEKGPPQSWLLNYINTTQGEMEIPRGDPACVFMYVLYDADMVLPFLLATAVQTY